MNPLPWVYDNGNWPRIEKWQDCVIRAVAIASGKPYREVSDYIPAAARHERVRKSRGAHVRHGIRGDTARKIAEHFGGIWHPTMGIGTGCRVHLRQGELPRGRLVCSLSGHYTAVIDGVIHDTHDPSRNGTRCVYGYFVFDGKTTPARVGMNQWEGDMTKRQENQMDEQINQEYKRQAQGKIIDILDIPKFFRDAKISMEQGAPANEAVSEAVKKYCREA